MPHEKNQPNSDSARIAAEAAIRAARQDGRNVSVAIVDNNGHDVLVVRDGAAWFTPGIARAKAATAALMAMPTAAYAELSERIPELAKAIDAQSEQSFTSLPGGLPLIDKGVVIGGIGVSGATPDQDVTYAEAGAGALQQMTR